MTRVRKILHVAYRNMSKAILTKIEMCGKQFFAPDFIFIHLKKIYGNLILYKFFFLNIRYTIMCVVLSLFLSLFFLFNKIFINDLN